MTAWIAVLAAGAVSFALRLAPARWAGGRPLPEGVQRGLTFLGPAAFAALAAPAVLVAHGPAAPLAARVLAVTAAFPVARATGSTGWTLAVGLPTLWLVTALVGA